MLNPNENQGNPMKRFEKTAKSLTINLLLALASILFAANPVVKRGQPMNIRIKGFVK